MSPPGIPLFYGADDVDTALAEVGHADPREFVTVGKFVATRPVTVIDLTHVPPEPSIFDPKLGGAQGELRFLNDLVEELRQSIDSTRSDLDYVPTEVFCEYFLRVFDQADVRGLMWTSALAAGGSACVALDVAQEDCIDVADATVDRLQLHLVPGSVTVYQRRTDEFRQL
jgi:RES domain